MQISARNDGNATTLMLAGRFDFNAHRDFRKGYEDALNAGGINELVLDMRGVDYLDSSALGMLMLLNERAKAVNKPVTLLNTSGVVSQVLGVANFSKIFNIKHAS